MQLHTYMSVEMRRMRAYILPNLVDWVGGRVDSVCARCRVWAY